MNKQHKNLLISVIICILLLSLTGCQPETKVDQRQDRLYSVENMELKKQVNSLEKKYEKDMATKKAELDKCNRQLKQVSKELGNDAMTMFETDLINSLMKQIDNLTKENQKLKARIKELEKIQVETSD
jgi:hypothetical protein